MEAESSQGSKASKPLLLHHTCYPLSLLLVQKSLNIPFLILTLLHPMAALYYVLKPPTLVVTYSSAEDRAFIFLLSYDMDLVDSPVVSTAFVRLRLPRLRIL